MPNPSNFDDVPPLDEGPLAELYRQQIKRGNEMAYDGPTITVKEFRELGFIQEINRLLLHPLGLALEVIVDSETGEERIERVWDGRDDPEGWTFGEGIIDADKARRIQSMLVRGMGNRMLGLGFDIQPLPVAETVQVRYLAERTRFAWRGAMWQITERGATYVEACNEQFSNIQLFKQTAASDEHSWFTYVSPMP